jgi:plastocyanin
MPGAPNFSASDPFNSTGSCFAADVYKAGFLQQVQDSLGQGSLETGGCTSQDVKVAEAIINSYSINGGPTIVFHPGDQVNCGEGDAIQLNLNARVAETATSERTDIGIWIANDGGNARVGECKHFNLVNGTTGVSDFDGDQCGDMNDGDTTNVQMGTIDAICHAVGPGDSLHIGSCLAWTQPGTGGDDRTCPTTEHRSTIAAPVGADQFRYGTTPGTTSKCNCTGFNVPIIVTQVATLEVVKTCVPSTDAGTFDLEIDDVVKKAGATCTSGGTGNNTTGAVEVSAGTNAVPGDDHTFAESGFTFANYTSRLVSCKDNGVDMAAPAPGAYSPDANLSIHVLPNHAYVCTFENTRKAGITIVKQTNPDGATGSFSFSHDVGSHSTPTVTTPFLLSDGQSQTFLLVDPGTYHVTEALLAGFDLVAGGDGFTTGCSDGNSTISLATRAATINLEAGENVTCTFVNEQRGQINIVKQTDPNGATGNFSFSHNVGANSDPTVTSPFSLSDGQTQQILKVKPGQYTVTEAALAGFDLVASGDGFTTACSDGNSTISLGTRAATINVEPGETVTCTFVNRKRATITVNKRENGALPLSRPWTFEIRTGASTLAAGTVVATGTANVTTGVVNFSCSPDPNSVCANVSGIANFVPGTYQFCETGMPVNFSNNIPSPPGFTPLGAVPEGGDNSTECVEITLGAGGSGVPTGIPDPINNLFNPPSGDARTIGYWKNWSSCAQSNGKQYTKALSRNEWNKTLDGNLPQTIGDLVIPGAPAPNQPATGCAIAVAILNKSDIVSGKKMASDPAYNLAAQLLAAKLNVTAGAGTCAAATTAIADAQALLDLINFTGTGSYKNKMTAAQQAQANALAATLDSYNNNTLCP